MIFLTHKHCNWIINMQVTKNVCPIRNLQNQSQKLAFMRGRDEARDSRVTDSWISWRTLAPRSCQRQWHHIVKILITIRQQWRQCRRRLRCRGDTRKKRTWSACSLSLASPTFVGDAREPPLSINISIHTCHSKFALTLFLNWDDARVFRSLGISRG